MMRRGFAIFTAMSFLTLASSALQAGMLNGHADAYAGWTGTSSFDNGNNFEGTVDYSVFTASDFNANFSGMGYAPAGSYVYTYQVLNSGSDNFSSLLVGVNNPTTDIGTFNIGDIDAATAMFDGSGNAEFQFTGAPVTTSMSSYGLAFSAPTPPEEFVGNVFNGGGQILGLALPSPREVPEPTAAVLAIGGMMLAGGRRRSRS